MAADTGQAALFDPPGAAPPMLRDAVISDDEVYRYVLNRRWWHPGPVLAWIMLNPSTADAETDDPTVTRCIRRTQRWKLRGIPYGGICVLNLFALRATEPAALRAHPDPVGPDNDRWLAGLVSDAGSDPVVAAWGAHGALHGRAATVTRLLAGVPLHCLGTTSAGQPKHPLYVAYDTPLTLYRPAELT